MAKQSKAVAKRDNQKSLVTRRNDGLMEWSDQEKALICQNLNTNESITFLRVCHHLQLDPLAGQIYAWVYNATKPDKRRMVVYTSIDGQRTIASRTGKYGGTTGARLRVRLKDGQSITVPHEEYDPKEHKEIISGTIGVRHKDFDEPIFATAVFQSYVKTGEGGEVWTKHPDTMILKCAEAKAHRMAFPRDLSKIYIREELSDDGVIDADFSVVGDQEPLDNELPEGTEHTTPENAQQEGIFGNDGGNSVVKVINDAIKAFHSRGLSDEGEAWIIEHLCARSEVSAVDEIPAKKAQEIKEYLRSDNFVGELMDRKYLPRRAYKE
jgi:phage recombination protein Bet